MRIIHYHSPSGNFGDDLNEILWRELLPPDCFAPDDTVLLGIGSIFRDDFLSEEATRNKRVFVLGSGAGTGPLPRLWPRANWSVLAVRGPLTAKLIGRPETAVTDSAALLATTPRLLPRPTGADEGDVVFLPHYNSVPHSRWPEVCKLADILFVDPHRPPREILQILGRARLVITEAMHGAIVADTLRVPWIPVVCSPSIVSFKWVDWTQSLNLEYRPLVLPPSSGWEILKHFKIRMAERREVRKSLAQQPEQDLIRDFYQRYGDAAIEDLAPKPVLNAPAKSAVKRMASLFDRFTIPRAAEALSRAARSRAYLSDDRILANRVERLDECVTTLHRALAA